MHVGFFGEETPELESGTHIQLRQVVHAALQQILLDATEAGRFVAHRQVEVTYIRQAD